MPRSEIQWHADMISKIILFENYCYCHDEKLIKFDLGPKVRIFGIGFEVRYLHLPCTLSLAYLPLGHLGHAPPPLWTANKILCMAKNAAKMRHFQAKISQIFWGGRCPLPRLHPYLHRGPDYPWPDPSPLGAASTPSNFFPNFYHYASIRCCNWRIWEIKSLATVLLVDLGLLNGRRLRL